MTACSSTPETSRPLSYGLLRALATLPFTREVMEDGDRCCEFDYDQVASEARKLDENGQEVGQ